jgi:hypothetical protein
MQDFIANRASSPKIDKTTSVWADSATMDDLDTAPAPKRRKVHPRRMEEMPNKDSTSAVNRSSGVEVEHVTVTSANPPDPAIDIPSTSSLGLEDLVNVLSNKSREIGIATRPDITTDPLPEQTTCLSRYLEGRRTRPTEIGFLPCHTNHNQETKIITSHGDNVDLHLPLAAAPGSKMDIDPPTDEPSNPEDVQNAVNLFLQSSSALRRLQLVVDNEVLNKRSLVLAFERLHVQLHGHDSLEADFLLDARTACIQLPLMSLPSMMDQLVSRGMMLAHRFEHLIFVFVLYPAERSNAAILPNPWNSATRDAFSRFEGRLKRQIAVKLGSTYQGGFSHTINVHLSDTSATTAALLRLHLEKAQMPLPATDLSRWTMEPLEETAFAWLSTELDTVSWIPQTCSRIAADSYLRIDRITVAGWLRIGFCRCPVHRSGLWRRPVPAGYGEQGRRGGVIRNVRRMEIGMPVFPRPETRQSKCQLVGARTSRQKSGISF